ncbi:MAG: hypothetical protein ABIS50_12515 [Luteolibacter sp.]|uniref:hypothetical protein n=1 Tax=Luteolibacter sp. TaxID=1962973 RepID=UPI0032648793
MREMKEAAIAENQPPSAAALEEIFQSASQIIQEKKLTPESEGAEKLENNLTQMLRNGDARIYDLISQLPPGYYSESIVQNAFMRAQFSDLKSIFDAAASIQEKDLHRAAISGAVGTLMMGSQAGAPLNVTRDDIGQLRAAGLDSQHLTSMIVQGVLAGNLETSDIVAEVDSSSNEMLNTAFTRLPAAKAKEIFIEALKQKKPVDLASAGYLANSLFHENPAEAVSWFSQFPAETAVRGTSNVVREWMAADPRAASSFVGGMPAGQPKDAAVALIVSDCLLNGDQQSASEWAERISDDKLKEKTQVQVRNWKQR